MTGCNSNGVAAAEASDNSKTWKHHLGKEVDNALQGDDHRSELCHEVRRRRARVLDILQSATADAKVDVLEGDAPTYTAPWMDMLDDFLNNIVESEDGYEGEEVQSMCGSVICQLGRYTLNQGLNI